MNKEAGDCPLKTPRDLHPIPHVNVTYYRVTKQQYPALFIGCGVD